MPLGCSICERGVPSNGSSPEWKNIIFFSFSSVFRVHRLEAPTSLESRLSMLKSSRGFTVASFIDRNCGNKSIINGSHG